MSGYELISVDYLFHTAEAPQLDPELSLTTSEGTCMHVYVCIHVRVRACACVCVCE